MPPKSKTKASTASDSDIDFSASSEDERRQSSGKSDDWLKKLPAAKGTQGDDDDESDFSFSDDSDSALSASDDDDDESEDESDDDDDDDDDEASEDEDEDDEEVDEDKLKGMSEMQREQYLYELDARRTERKERKEAQRLAAAADRKSKKSGIKKVKGKKEKKKDKKKAKKTKKAKQEKKTTLKGKKAQKSRQIKELSSESDDDLSLSESSFASDSDSDAPVRGKRRTRGSVGRRSAPPAATTMEDLVKLMRAKRRAEGLSDIESSDEETDDRRRQRGARSTQGRSSNFDEDDYSLGDDDDDDEVIGRALGEEDIGSKRSRAPKSRAAMEKASAAAEARRKARLAETPFDLEHALLVQLRRSHVEKLCGEPYFEDYALGLLVRVVGGTDEQGQPIYQCAEIVRLEPTKTSYRVGKSTVHHNFVVRLGESQRRFPIHAISNHSITQSELDRFIRIMKEAEIPVLSNERATKLRQRKDHLRRTYTYSAEVINQLLSTRARERLVATATDLLAERARLEGELELLTREGGMGREEDRARLEREIERVRQAEADAAEKILTKVRESDTVSVFELNERARMQNKNRASFAAALASGLLASSHPAYRAEAERLKRSGLLDMAAAAATPSQEEINAELRTLYSRKVPRLSISQKSDLIPVFEKTPEGELMRTLHSYDFGIRENLASLTSLAHIRDSIRQAALRFPVSISHVMDASQSAVGLPAHMVRKEIVSESKQDFIPPSALDQTVYADRQSITVAEYLAIMAEQERIQPQQAQQQ